MSFRIEEKLFIKSENLIEFKEYLLKQSAKQIYQPRKSKSLYFDNLNLDMYNDSIEGVLPRKKIRVRNYPDGDDKKYYLEIKNSSVEGRFKTRKIISVPSFDKYKNVGIFDDQYGELLGAHIIGDGATEMIAELNIAKSLETTWEDIAMTMHAHPTLSEAVMEAALDAYGSAIHQ